MTYLSVTQREIIAKERARRAVFKRIKTAKFDHRVLYGYPTSKILLKSQFNFDALRGGTLPIPESSLLFPRYYQYIVRNQISVIPQMLAFYLDTFVLLEGSRSKTNSALEELQRTLSNITIQNNETFREELSKSINISEIDIYISPRSLNIRGRLRLHFKRFGSAIKRTFKRYSRPYVENELKKENEVTKPIEETKVVTKHPSKSLSNPSDDNEQIITPVAPGLTLKRDLDTLSPSKFARKLVLSDLVNYKDFSI